MKRYLTEFIGTFFLVFTICLTAMTGVPNTYAPLAIGAILMAMVFMGGHVSGAHYNPAVSLAACIRGRLATKELIPYWLSQVLGSIFAALLAYYFLQPNYPNLNFVVAPDPRATIPGALLAEFLFTFALVLVILNAATAKGTANNSFYGLAIGFTVTGGAFAVGGVSGAAFNPAVAIGPTLVSVMHGHGSLNSVWIYLVANFAGGAVAATVFKLQNSDSFD